MGLSVEDRPRAVIGDIDRDKGGNAAMKYLDRLLSESLLTSHRLSRMYIQDEVQALFNDYRRTILDPTEGTWLIGRKVENWHITLRLMHNPAVLRELPTDLDWSFEWYMQHDIEFLKSDVSALRSALNRFNA